MSRATFRKFSPFRARHIFYGASAAATAATAYAVHTSWPAENSYAANQFNTHVHEAPFRWYAAMLSLCFTNQIGDGASGDLVNYLFRAYMIYHYHTIFEKNIENRALFRGEYAADAEKAVGSGRALKFVDLENGDFYLPHVEDATLRNNKAILNNSRNANCFTHATVALTCEMSVTTVYGNAEAVLVAVPEWYGDLSHHGTVEDNNGQYEYAVGYLPSDRIIGIGYRDPDTQEFVKFVLNDRFALRHDKLRLDEQVLPLIRLLDEKDPRKKQLLKSIDPTFSWHAHYDANMPPTDHDHSRKLAHRKQASFQRLNPLYMNRIPLITFPQVFASQLPSFPVQHTVFFSGTENVALAEQTEKTTVAERRRVSISALSPTQLRAPQSPRLKTPLLSSSSFSFAPATPLSTHLVSPSPQQGSFPRNLENTNGLSSSIPGIQDTSSSSDSDESDTETNNTTKKSRGDKKRRHREKSVRFFSHGKKDATDREADQNQLVLEI